MLVHTGVHQAYDGIRKAIAEVLDPASLAYVVLLHFEGDECGGMEPLHGRGPERAARRQRHVGDPQPDLASASTSSTACKGVRDGDVIETGRHTAALPGDAARAPLGLDDGLRGVDRRACSPPTSTSSRATSRRS